MKRGFTLVELLAVIVILAIIALIATPIILNIIATAQEGANLRNVEGYAKALETSYYTNMMNGKSTSLNDLTTEYNGATVVCATKEITNNKLILKDCTVDGKATKTGESSTPTLLLNVCDDTTCSKGTVYYNPTTAEFCTKADYDANTTASNTGNTIGCMKWYTYKDN